MAPSNDAVRERMEQRLRERKPPCAECGHKASFHRPGRCFDNADCTCLAYVAKETPTNE